MTGGGILPLNLRFTSKESLGNLTRQIGVEGNGSISARGFSRHRIVGLRRGNARHRLKHVATRRTPAGPHTDIQCRTADGTSIVQTVSAAATTLPTTPTRDAARVKRYCTDRATFTLLRCTTDELFFSYCDSVVAHFKHSATRQPRRKPAVETFVHTTAKKRPQASVLALRAAGAKQLLRPASTTPRSYGRRHRSWRAHFKHAATRQPRRKPTVETCVDTTAKLRPQASVLALRAAGANQLVRPASTTPRSYGRRNRS